MRRLYRALWILYSIQWWSLAVYMFRSYLAKLNASSEDLFSAIQEDESTDFYSGATLLSTRWLLLNFFFNPIFLIIHNFFPSKYSILSFFCYFPYTYFFTPQETRSLLLSTHRLISSISTRWCAMRERESSFGVCLHCKTRKRASFTAEIEL